MESVSTGFADLDKALKAGLARPSCICINGDASSSQRNFALQIVHTFLENDLKGLYVCLDRPANEVRSQFGRLGLDITAFSENYSLFFIDFFSASQHALIETATLQTLEYEPNELLKTLSPFLDWIKNGFILIDSVSTLTLNMDAKEAYEFMRGLKLLGRAFNIITAGISHISVSDPKILELIISNSDGNLIFKGETLLIDRFESNDMNNEILFITKSENNKIDLRLALPETASQETDADMLALLANSEPLKLTPYSSLAATPETEFPLDEVLETIKTMEQEKIVRATPYCSSVSCSNCNSQTLELYLQCPDCDSKLLEKGEILEHFLCGHIDFETNFQSNGKLACTKCGKQLKQIGVDYRRIGVGYRCTNKHVFSTPIVTFYCPSCKQKFDLCEAKLQNQCIYELTEKGQRQAINEGY